MSEAARQPDRSVDGEWTTTSDPRFVDYYARQSLSAESVARSRALMERLLVFVEGDRPSRVLRVGDVGCGPGAQALVWARAGHRVRGVDISEPLVELASERAREEGIEAEFRVGSATDLPWESESLDVCIVPELLEHVADWQPCLDEFARVLVPGGVLYLSTSNRLCPKQQEFALPLYSWYPGRLKRHYEELAVTTRPELVNHASYPAVNWFDYFQLRRELEGRGLRGVDRFEFGLRAGATGLKRAVFSVLGSVAPLQLLGQMATPYTLIVATKSPVEAQSRP